MLFYISTDEIVLQVQVIYGVNKIIYCALKISFINWHSFNVQPHCEGGCLRPYRERVEKEEGSDREKSFV